MTSNTIRVQNTTTRDFVPRNADQFLHWGTRMLEYITPAKATAWAIPASELTAAKEAMGAFADIQQNLPNDPTRAQIERRNAAQRQATTQLRYLVQNYLRRQSRVSDADLLAMGIPPIDRHRTPHIDVRERVAVEIQRGDHRTVIIDFWQEALEKSKARPRGYTGAVFCWTIAETPPQDLEKWHFRDLITRRPHRFVFEEADRGKRVWFCAAWQNARGLKGVFSPPVDTIIP